jgi:Cys-tRNA(Pro) deacylase
MHRNAVRVVEAAAQQGLHITIREFPEGTRTALDAAAAIGVSVGQIVKSLVFAVSSATNSDEREIVLALVSGSNQLDVEKLANLAGSKKAWRVDANAVREATGFAVGGVAPLGHPAPLRTWVDNDLLQYGEVWAAAGTPHHVFGIEPNELLRVSQGTAADLAS